MQLIKKPSAYTFAGNCAKIEVTTSALAQLLLNLDGIELLRESYEPTAGLVTIDLTEILLKYTPSAALAVGAINIPRFSFTISNAEGSVSGEFFAINGGHGASVDAQTFLKQNWLTWQPQSRTTSYHAPQRLVYAAIAPCSVLVKAYFADKSTLQAEHSKLVAGKLYTIDATFGTIRGLFSQQPVSFDIWVEGVGIKSYPQRYYLAAENKNSDVFLWRNSIGGIDTVAFAGDRVEKHKSDSSAALLDDAEIEYDINAKKSFLKYTGYFDNENERLWVLDFFNSRDRYHLDDGVIRRVVVTKPKLEHTRGELAGYEFEFAHSDQSVYLNLPKVETPALLEIADPTGELFFLAPRLNQFAAAEIAAGDILIPCQYAGAEKWLYVAVSDIVSNFGTAGSGGSAGPIRVLAPIGAKYVDGTLTITHNLAPADVAKFGTADKTGHAMVAPHPYGGRGDVDFAAKIASAIKLLLTSEASSPDYVKSLTGFSLKKNEHGKWTLELDNISVRESLSVPEFIKNRITVTNNQMWITDNGIIDDVAEIPGSPGERLITVAQDKGGGSTFVVDDLLKGLFLDEKNGSLNFQTVLLTVRQVISPYVLRVSVDANTPPPRKELIIVRAGNRTNAERQNSIFIDAARPAMFFYVNVDSHQISERNIAQATGNLQGMNFGKITDYKPITERFSSIMRGDNYIVGRLMGLSGDGIEYHIPVDRGEWMAGTYYHYDRVSCDGAMWDCAVTETTTRPAADALDWTKRVSKGEPGDVGDSVTGKMLYRDPEFRKGVNGCGVYAYNNPGNVKISRIEKPADCPTTSTHCLEVRITGAPSYNYLGGFCQSIQSRANAVFLQKFIAKIPVGYELWALANSLGDGTTDEFITPNVGTGKYETYLRKTVCGATGTFQNGGYVRLTGNPLPTPANPVVWQVASCTCYDLTDSEKYDDAIEKAQTDTDRANALLADIANDDKLIPSEKSTTRSEWEAIINERANLIAQFNLYSIDHTQYDLNYTSLAEYLAPLLREMSVTSDIIGSTFRSKFNNYYYERQLLLYRVSAAAKNETLESLAQNKATKDFVDILQSNVNKELLEVNKRLDGVIDSYFETYNPTLTNLPASEWLTDKDKESHLGDTFTNKATGNSWKWKIIGGVWQWVEITDTIEKELLKKIASAQDTADSKRRNFVSTPTTPYDIGDTWSAGIGSDLMRCISARVSGAFVATDWDKATKYTDDTKALEALAESNKANAQLAEIASDGKLTPSEKQQTAIEWSRIRAEQAKNTDTATTLHVSTGEVLAAFNTLNGYITPLLANLSVTSDINGGQFRATFAAWYEKNIALVNAISKANADKAAGDVEIGGVNLISNSRLFTGTSSNPWAFVGAAFVPEKGRTYTFSFKNTGTKPVAALISNKNADGTSLADNTSAPIAPGSYGYVTNVTHDTSPYIQYGVYTADGGAIGTFSVEFATLEVGNKATAWSLSPDDVAAAAAADAKAKSDAALATSKTYAEAQKTLAETNAAAYADGKVTAEEERAIADATAKANAAKEAAIAAAAADAKAKLDLAFADRNFITKIPTIVAAGYHDLILSKQFAPMAGDVYRLTFVCSADSYTPSRADLYISYNNKQGYNSGFSVYFSSYVQGTYTNKVVSLEVRIPSDFGSYKSCVFVNLGGNSTFSARDLKLKLGNVTTDYTLAPEDIIDGIDKKNEVNIINTRKWWYDGGRGDGVYYTLKPSDRTDIFGQVLTFKLADASVENFGSIYLFQVVDNRDVQIGYSSVLNDPLTAVLSPSATELQVAILRASGNSGRVGTPKAAILVKGRTAPADWSPAPNEIDSAMTDLSKTFGFSDIATLSEWLAKYPGNVPFLSDPATNQTFLSNAIVKRLAVDTAFINELMANEAFIGKLTVGSLNTKPSQQTNRVEVKEDTMTVYDASNRAVSTFNGSPMPALSEFEQDGASGSVSGGSFAIQSAANPGATRTVCSLSVTRNNASLRIQSSISLIFNHIGNKPLVGEATLELWRGGSLYTVIASAIDENTISVDRSVNVEAWDYSLVLRCIRWSGQLDSEIRGYVGSTTMSFAVVDDALKTMFGANGYGVRANKFSYEHTVFNPSTRRLEKTYKGGLNMPGILAKAHVNFDGIASRRWGAFPIDRALALSGPSNRRILHAPIAGTYSAFCTAYGGGADPKVYYEGPDYVDVYVEGDINIMLVGSNE